MKNEVSKARVKRDTEKGSEADDTIKELVISDKEVDE